MIGRTGARVQIRDVPGGVRRQNAVPGGVLDSAGWRNTGQVKFGPAGTLHRPGDVTAVGRDGDGCGCADSAESIQESGDPVSRFGRGYLRRGRLRYRRSREQGKSQSTSEDGSSDGRQADVTHADRLASRPRICVEFIRFSLTLPAALVIVSRFRLNQEHAALERRLGGGRCRADILCFGYTG